MIAANEPQEFVPRGRQQANQHPGPIETLKKFIVADQCSEKWILRLSPEYFDDYAVKTVKEENKNNFEQEPNENSQLYQSKVNLSKKRLSDVAFKRIFSGAGDSKTCQSGAKSPGNSINNKSLPITCKPLLNFMEEELYFKENTVIWSRGISCGDPNPTQDIISCYSSTFPIKQALWCNFYCEKPILNIENQEICNDDLLNDPIPGVIILDTHYLRTYIKESEDFTVALMFQVKKVWTTKFGVLLERDTTTIDKNNKTCVAKSPVMYSLSHPLDELSPVVLKHHNTQIANDEAFKVVFTSESPSICMIYDANLGVHNVYKIRRLFLNEWVDDLNKTEGYSHSSFSTSSKMKNITSIWDHLKPNMTTPGAPSPFSTRSNSYTSGQSGYHPSGSQSPMIYNNSSTSIGSLTPSNLKSSRMNSLLKNVNVPKYGYIEMEDGEILPPTTPKICLEHLWTENPPTNLDALNGSASKAFITEDFTSQNYLCFMVPSKNQLYVVKIEISINNVIFGMSMSIGAKDAISIPSMHMYGILEHSGNVVLYSGLTMIGKLNIGGVLPQHISSPYVMENIRHLQSPFPRRSSLLPTSDSSAAAPRFDEHLLSPVLPTVSSRPKSVHISTIISGDSKPQLIGLRDPVLNRITLQYSDDTFYRIKIPYLSTSTLVESCLNALRECLPRDVLMTVIVRWYTTRNSLGNFDLTPEKEWELFYSVIFQLLGYEDSNVSNGSSDNSSTPSSSSKRSRHSFTPNNSNWDYLLTTNHHKKIHNHLSKILHLKPSQSGFDSKQTNPNCGIQVNTNSVLFPYIKIIHFTLHLLYEDLKLNTLRKNELKHLAQFLSKISHDLCLIEFQVHYWKDYPDTCKVNYDDRKMLNEQELKGTLTWSGMSNKPSGIFQFLYELLNTNKLSGFPYIKNVNSRTKNVIQLFVFYIKYSKKDVDLNIENLINIISPSGLKQEIISEPKLLSNCSHNNLFRVIEMMTHLGITNRELETYPSSIYLILYDTIWLCRENPPNDWPTECYTLLQRPDLTALTLITNKENKSESIPIFSQTESETDDGMEDTDNALLKLRFPNDLRVLEVRRLLCSSKPVPVIVTQRPDVSDHDYIEEQERHLYALCSRTMALPVGRGIFTLRMASPVITEPLTVPPLCLTGKAPPRGTTVELSHIDTPPSMNHWPLFHNGVANGLRICPEAKIDSTWIVFNKPTGSSEIEHGGFLLAMGLNGHLKNLETKSIFDYLSKAQETITVGVLLGLAAAFRGTCDVNIARMLSIHSEALLPPTSMEMEVSHNSQIATLLGIGLLYQGTAHRHMTEVLLNEIGRPPGPEMDNSVDRESYALAAGLGLGLVILGQGDKPCGLGDLNIADTLHYYIIGGNKRPRTGPQREKYKIPSFQIKEGATVNLDVTASGSTLALGMMYFGTGNKVVADWMSIPDTQFLLDAVRPDFLILRTLAKSLILWNDIEASIDWIEGHIPANIKPFCMVEPWNNDIDYEAVNQAYCNIVSGACFALGLKHAGSANEQVFQVLLHYCHLFTSLLGKSLAELAGKPCIECCLNLVLLSTSMVMAGTGNIEIMRIIRHLRRRVGTAASAVVTYGSHLATHMALGLLFLGGGRYTLCNNPASVAALIIAFYPKFPMHSNDNRYHLQAFRHLYVLAIEPRLLVTKDVMKGKMCYANLSLIKLNGETIQLKAPALLPELNSLFKVCVDDERYLPVVFERGRNWDKLESILSTYKGVCIMQRAGCGGFSEEDNENNRLELTEKSPWLPSKESILTFSPDCTVWSFCNYFLSERKDLSEKEHVLKQQILRGSYESVIGDKLNVLPIFLNLLKVIENISSIDYIQLWQFKIISRAILKRNLCTTLISIENMSSMRSNILDYLERQEIKLKQSIKSYLNGKIDDCKNDVLYDLVSYVTFFDIPFHFNNFSASQNKFEMMQNLKLLNVPLEMLNKVITLSE
nr:anaphase-promoting complex subunit 1 [Onthophagus taurus]